jgi:PilZ domain
MKTLDRRFRPRFDMRVQVKIRNLDSPALTEQLVESSNISARGFYFSTDNPLDIGARVEMFLTMPTEVVGQDARVWRCTGRVVRMQPGGLAQRKAGNGVEIHYYEILDKARSVAPTLRDGGFSLP